jgi:hypothetical protein
MLWKKCFWSVAIAATIAFMPSAHTNTIENDLFVCTGELIRYSATDYSIKETWVKDEDAYPMDCYIDKGKVLRQVLAVCRIGDLCVVSAKGESGNGNRHVIQKIFEVQRSPQKVEDLKSQTSGGAR